MYVYDNIQSILPSSVEIKYNYINIFGKYISSIIITDYPQFISMLDVPEIIKKCGECDISFFMEKEDKSILLRKLTTYIAKNKSEINTTHDNRQDLELINNMTDFAKYLRKEIQVNNEEIYSLSIYITINKESLNELQSKIRKLIEYLFSKQISAKQANFIQKETYLATLPILSNIEILKNVTPFYLTASALAYTFPFYTKQIFQENGILLGFTNNNICKFNLFNENNTNYNMCVLGSSGAGKSYFIKLMILKNIYLGKKQIIFDPEGEYEDIVCFFEGKIISPDTYNFLEIDENFILNNKETFLNKKIDIIICQMKSLENINEISEKILRTSIEETFNLKGITNDIKTIYKEKDINIISMKKKLKNFPKPEELFKIIKKNDLNDNIGEKIYKILKDFKAKEITNQNKEINIKLFKLNGLQKNQFVDCINFYINGLLEYSDNSIIYIDEIWKCISFGSDERLAGKIYELFKTLRKQNSGIVAITQDISDFFAYQDGVFGKSIFNNSFNRVFFKLEYTDSESIKKIIFESEEGIQKIKTLSKGTALFYNGNNKFNLEVKCSKWEHDLIEGRKIL